jgi:hypothetical protein
LNMVTADKWIYFLENKLLPKIKNENWT